MSDTNRTSDRRLAPHLSRLRHSWPQAWISEECDGGGKHLVAVPGFLLPKGWNATICTALWLARVSYRHDRVESHFDGFWVDLPDLRLADGRIPHYSRGTYDLYFGGRSEPYIPEFPHWKDLTHFWWKAQMWDPNTDNIYTHAMLVRQRLRMVQ